jgi:hypothetical protein
MRALKTLVIVMGILILAGLALVGYVLVKRGLNTAPAMPTAPSAPQAPIAGEGPYGPVELALPSGAKIVSTRTAGGRLVVELALPNGVTRELVVGLTDGKLIGTIDLKPQP